MHIAAERIRNLPPYLFAELDRLKRKVAESGKKVINLGVGDPDLPTPQFVIDALFEAAQKVENHHYPAYAGTKAFKQAVADWYKKRFDVILDPETEVLALIGSKDGIAHLPLAMINPGDQVVVPNPGYPVYQTATEFVGGKVKKLNLDAINGFLPKYSNISDRDWSNAKLLFLNYPNNPTSATCDASGFDEAIALANKHQFYICHDNAYSELYYDSKPSASYLQAKGAKEVGIEMHSLSKSFNMTGWRVGFAVGNAEIIAALSKVKENVDSGVFQAVQEAAVAALRDGDDFLNKQRGVFQKRRDVLVESLKQTPLEFNVPEATFYIWAKVPGGQSSIEFCKRVLEEAAVVTTPGNGMGDNGEGYFRLTITAPTEELEEAGKRLAKFLSNA